jgi:Flp pilus assembly pilin Flp
MLKLYVKSRDLVDRLRADKEGVVSFEYVIVAACIVAVVAIAFGPNGPLEGALNSALDAIGNAVVNAVNNA